MNKLININYRDLFCGNCGKYGHIYKKCRDPITSIGIILFKLDNHTAFIKKFNNFLEKNNNTRYISITHYNSMHNDNLKYIKEYTKKVKFLLIRRKHTLGYIEFLRGRYEIDDVDVVISLFEQMTSGEIDDLNNKNFNELWADLWKTTANNKSYELEFELSRKKFNLLKISEKHPDLAFYIDNIKPKYSKPEWGFPKGRRDNKERNVECAKRELYEETGYRGNEYLLLKKMIPLQEIVIGTNSVEYKHIYFTGINTTSRLPLLDIHNIKQIEEVGKLGWYTHLEASNMLRPYHRDKKKILNELLLFIIDIMRNY